MCQGDCSDCPATTQEVLFPLAETGDSRAGERLELSHRLAKFQKTERDIRFPLAQFSLATQLFCRGTTFSFIFNFLNWIIVDLQCFRCIAKWCTYTDSHIFFFKFFSIIGYCLWLRCVQLFATPRTVAQQAHLSMGSPARNWSKVAIPFSRGGIFPIQGLNLGFPHCRQILYCPSHQGRLNIEYGSRAVQ